MSKSAYLCLTFMIVVGALSFVLRPDAAVAAFAVIALFSCGYFVYFLIKNNLHHGILRGLLLSVLVLALAAIPVIGWIAIVAFVIYNIVKSLDGLKSLLPDVLASLVIYGLLSARLVFDIRDPIALSALAGFYLIAAVVYCRSLNGFSTQQALFKMSVMWLSIPFAVLTIVSLISALGTMFRTISSTVTRTVISPQLVSAHMRGGMQIDAYTRNISSTVTSTVTNVVPGAGVITAGVTGEVAQKVKKENT